MSAGSSLPYRLRPNKAVDRELFILLLTRLAPSFALENYQYIGLGGPFLEDFRLIHGRLGLRRMTCLEVESKVYKRQIFNRPVESIECINQGIEAYLDSHEFDVPAIVWFDYTEPSGITSQIERFAQTIGTVPIRSILRVTLNANPASLGKPDAREVSVEIDGDASVERDKRPTVQEWRLARFRERLGALFPSGLTAAGMSFKSFGQSVLRALKLAVEKEALSFRERQIVWALSTHYADGQPMVTATLIVNPADDDNSTAIIKDWEFYSPPEAPHCIDLPALSTLERLTMESDENAMKRLGFELPRSDMGEDPFGVFKKFYRIYPHFSRVEL